MPLLSTSYIIITLDILKELTDILSHRKANYFRNKKLPFDTNKKYESPLDKFNFDFDTNAKFKLYTPILKGSYDEIESHYNNPSILLNSIEERKQNEAGDKIIEKE
jgi:hypothetical protein